MNRQAWADLLVTLWLIATFGVLMAAWFDLIP